MFVDSHCHLSFPELSQSITDVLAAMRAAGVDRALNICTTMEEFESVVGLAERHDHIWATVGVHPDTEGLREPTVEELVTACARARVVAVGETGLDYYQMESRKGGRGIEDMEWQRERFRTHIRAARRVGLPLVVHTRDSSADTIRILKEEGVNGEEGRPSGVFHCFTETLEVAQAAVELGFYISFSGILTFKSAHALREVAAWVPADRVLIETDSPYLAPVPYRGKTNSPAYVPYVAAELARLRGWTLEDTARRTSENFDLLFQPKLKLTT